MNESAPPVHAGILGTRTLRAHDVDTVFTLNGGHLLAPVRRVQGGGRRLVDTRHEQTAAFAAEGWAKVTRRVGVAALTAGSGRDQRRERHHERVDERLAGVRDRRPRAGRSVGPGVAPGARPRADRRAGHQVRGDGDLAPTPSWASSTRRCGRHGRRTGARRSSTCRSTRGARARPRSRGRSRCRRPWRARHPTPTRSTAVVAELAGAPSARCSCSGATSTGLAPSRGARARRGRAGSRSSSTTWAAALIPADHANCLLPRPQHRLQGGRRRRRDRHAARLPARLRSLRRRRGCPRDRRRPRASRPTRRSPRRPRATSRPSWRGWPTQVPRATSDATRAARDRLDRAPPR